MRKLKHVFVILSVLLGLMGSTVAFAVENIETYSAEAHDYHEDEEEGHGEDGHDGDEDHGEDHAAEVTTTMVMADGDSGNMATGITLSLIFLVIAIIAIVGIIAAVGLGVIGIGYWQSSSGD